MANGDPNYKIGELVGKVDGIETSIEQINKSITQINQRLKFLDKLQGGLSLTKWLVSIFGLGTVFNFIILIVQHFKF